MIETGTVYKIYKQEPYSFTAFRYVDQCGRLKMARSKMLPQISEGEKIKMEGEFVIDPKFGEQFEAKRLIEEDPVGANAIERMLAKGKIPGIGPVLARRIVDKFGDKTLEIIDADPTRLKEVYGIDQKRYNSISVEWMLRRKFFEAASFLFAYNIPTETVSELINTSGADGLNRRVRSNPYCLMHLKNSVSFRTCDRIAKDLHFRKDDPMRVEAAVEYILTQNASTGSIYMALADVEAALYRVLGIEKTPDTLTLLADRITPMVRTGVVIYDEDRDRLYSKRYYDAEQNIAKRVRDLRNPPPFITALTQLDLTVVEESIGVKFQGVQRDFLLGMHNYGIQILTGGPGTGKSTLLKGVVRALSLSAPFDTRIKCLAPTGRAARRLSEMTGLPAHTLHKERFMKSEEKEDVLIVDEMSMADLVIFSEVLNETSAKMVFLVGDPDQLPTVGPGDVLRDLIESKKVPTCKLRKIHRQSEGSSIIANAFKINSGEKELQQDESFQIIEKSDKIIVDETIRLYQQYLKQYNIMDVQIIVPMKKTFVSTTEINNRIQDILNPNGKEICVGTERVFRVGDKVMETTNCYQRNVYNGDIGIIKYVDDAGVVGIDYYGNLVEYKQHELQTLLLAYAITCHKSQGAEYPIVIYPTTMLHRVMLKRNLLYTAVTRAKERFIAVGSPYAVKLAIDSNDRSERKTTLREILG